MLGHVGTIQTAVASRDGSKLGKCNATGPLRSLDCMAECPDRASDGLESRPRLAGVAKLVDAPALGAGGLSSWGFESLRPHYSLDRSRLWPHDLLEDRNASAVRDREIAVI